MTILHQTNYNRIAEATGKWSTWNIWASLLSIGQTNEKGTSVFFVSKKKGMRMGIVLVVTALKVNLQHGK